MKGLRMLLNRQKPKFEKGGRYRKLSSTFDAFESFAYTPNSVTGDAIETPPGEKMHNRRGKYIGYRGAHIRDAVDIKRTVITLVIALMPALIFGMWNIGYQTSEAYHLGYGFWENMGFGFLRMLPLIVVSYATGLLIEFIFAECRHEQVSEGFIGTGILIAMIVPVNTPLWQLAIAVTFAVVVGKEAFGGSGYNFLNPALLARAFLFFSYPSHMSGDTVWIAPPIREHATDAITSATPLSELASESSVTASIRDMLIGTIPGSCGETSVVAILIGAAILIATGVASWRIMTGVVIGGGVMGIVFNFIGANAYMEVPFWQHYLMGGFMFGCVFMATDPVTAAHTQIGKWIYGLLVGSIAILLRVVNPAYPEGMMLSILLMNCFAPLIDHCVLSVNMQRRERRWKRAMSQGRERI